MTQPKIYYFNYIYIMIQRKNYNFETKLFFYINNYS